MYRDLLLPFPLLIFITISITICSSHSRAQQKIRKSGSSSSTSDDRAPDFADDVKLPSICPAVAVSFLVSDVYCCVNRLMYRMIEL